MRCVPHLGVQLCMAGTAVHALLCMRCALLLAEPWLLQPSTHTESSAHLQDVWCVHGARAHDHLAARCQLSGQPRACNKKDGHRAFRCGC